MLIFCILEEIVDLWLVMLLFMWGLFFVVIFVIKIVILDEIWDLILGLMIIDFMWIGNGSWKSNRVGDLIKWVVKNFCEFFFKFGFMRFWIVYLLELIIL